MRINAKSQTELSSYSILYDDCVLRERPGVYGISHLLEHLICTEIKPMEPELEQYAVHWNATTGNERVMFFLMGLNDCVSRFAERFTEVVLAGKFSEEEFANEKKIILEEYKDAFNEQYWAHHYNLMRKLFCYHGPVGLRQDLESLTYEACREYVALAFAKPTKIVCVSPTSSWADNQVIDFRERDGSARTHRTAVEPQYETANTFKDKTSVIYVSPLVTQDFAIIKFICSMLGKGLTSPLYDELREQRGLVYFVYCYLVRLSGGEGTVHVGTVTSNENIGAVRSTIEQVLGNPDQYLTRERYEIFRNHYRILRTKKEIQLESNIDLLLTPPEWNVFELVEYLSSKEVRDVYDRVFDVAGYHTSVDKEEFQSPDKEA